MIEVMLFIFCGARIQNTKLRRHQRNKKKNVLRERPRAAQLVTCMST